MSEQQQYPGFPYEHIIVRTEDNTRRDSTVNINELADSIKANGLLQPIGLKVVSSDSEEVTEEDWEALGLDEDERPEEVGILIFGFRRYHAIGKAMEEDEALAEEFAEGIPFTYAVGADEEKVEERIRNIVENLQREDLTPAEKAEAFHSLRYKEGLKLADIHERTGLSKGYISTLIKLRKDLSDEVFSALADQQITYDVARTIMDAGNHEEQNKVLKNALKAVEGQEGKKKKRGQRQAAKGASSNARPSVKDVKSVYRKHVTAFRKAEGDVDDFEQGVLFGLGFVLGDVTKIPAKATAYTPPPEKKKAAKKSTKRKTTKKARAPKKAAKASGKTAPSKAAKKTTKKKRTTKKSKAKASAA